MPTRENSRNRYAQNPNNYVNNSSSAYDYDYYNYDDYSSNYNDLANTQEYNPAPAKPRLRAIKRRKRTIAYRHLHEEIKFFSKESLIIIATIFVGSMAILFGNSTTTSKKVDITTVRNEIATLTKDNDTLKAEIDQSYDLVEIEYIATTQLGMSKPKSHQIVYINAEVDSYVKQYEEEKPTSIENSFFENFKARLINIFTF